MAPDFLAVVRRGEPGLFARLRAELEARGWAAVVWDRRERERRQHDGCPRPERRQQDRRGTTRLVSEAVGFVLVRAPSEPHTFSIDTYDDRQRAGP